jgi:3-phenylpropionate/trans-cinnamate dioxygenase ferredoxin subunit
MKIKVADSKEVKKNRPYATQVDGKKLLLIRTDAGLFAIDNSCPHQSQQLDTGIAEGSILTCRNHGVRIDVSTGAIVYDAGYLGLEPVKRFAVEELDGTISVDLA